MVHKHAEILSDYTIVCCSLFSRIVIVTTLNIALYCIAYGQDIRDIKMYYTDHDIGKLFMTLCCTYVLVVNVCVQEYSMSHIVCLKKYMIVHAQDVLEVHVQLLAMYTLLSLK